VTPQQLETISVHSIIEAWELASIPSSRTLLHILGFDEEDEVNLLQLTKALEEELRGLEGDQEQSNMLRALAALQATPNPTPTWYLGLNIYIINVYIQQRS